MFRQMLYTQWKWARLELIAYTLAGFLIPTAMLRTGFAYYNGYSNDAVMGTVQGIGAFFVVLALACAMGFAVRPWIADAALGHVCALSLPLRWSSYVRLRFLAGALLLVVPTLGVWLGGVMATAVTALPPTLHAYPGGVAIRFAMSALLFYAVFFLLQYGTGRRATKVAVAFLLALVVVELAGRLVGLSDPALAVWNALTTWPGPFETFTARWMLIDV